MTMLDQRRPEAPREGLVRMSTTIRSAADGNTLVGYAAVFNQPTTIDSWEGKFIEQIARGAFAKTLRERGDKVKVLFNHGMDPQIGDKPLGKPSVQREDATGLAVECPLDPTSYNEDIKALLRSGALDGMSFRMNVVNDRWEFPAEGENGLPVRTITEVKLLEWGPVTWPAYEATQAGVRSHAPAAFEAWRSAAQGTPKPPSTPAAGEQRMTDETPEDLVSSLDATLDAMSDALEAGDTEIVTGLLTAADAVVDDLMELMGIADPDEADAAPRSRLADAENRTTPAGAPATGEQDQHDENGPDDQATRSEDTYQPAQRPPMSHERRQAQAGLVRALLAQTSRSN